jgi:glycerol kinase
MHSGLILAIDQGTTNTKALLVEWSGEPGFRATSPVALIHTASGYVEQDPQQLWDSVQRVIAECALYALRRGLSIEAVAISNQRETAVAWDATTGEPIDNAISWQCARSAEICQRLSAHTDAIRAKTGLPLATLISAGKWAWLLEHDAHAQSHAQAGTLHLGTVDSWLIHRLTGGSVHATDRSNASRTGLLNLEQLTWDTGLLNLFGIPLASMPELRSSSGSFGVCSSIPELAGVPILAAIGDSHAAMFGHGQYTPGTVKATYGTGSSLMALTPTLADDTPVLARTVAWSIADQTQFAIEGNIAMTGSAVQWVGEFLQLADPAREAAALASTIPDANGVYFVPAMVGLGAPYWDAQAHGTITGLGRSHTAVHLARAAIEAIAYQVADVFFAMEHAGHVPFSALFADGGATRNRALIQFQADILGRPVLLPANEELSALGASRLAGLALGWWGSLDEIAALPRTMETFAPTMKAADRERLYTGWKAAIDRTMLRAEARA